MSRLWDTPEFWVRAEADELLRDNPKLTADGLADRFEQSRRRHYGDPQFVRDLVVELRRRARARVWFWPEGRPVEALREERVEWNAGDCTTRLSELLETNEPSLDAEAGYWWQRM